MNIADTRTSSTSKCDLLVPMCPLLRTLLRPTHVLLVICDATGSSIICPEFLCNYCLVHLSSFGIVSMR